MREQKLADRRIEREAVHALAGRVDQHGAGPVDNVARRDLAAAQLQHVAQLAARSRADLLEHRKDRPHGYVHIDVR